MKIVILHSLFFSNFKSDSIAVSYIFPKLYFVYLFSGIIVERSEVNCSIPHLKFKFFKLSFLLLSGPTKFLNSLKVSNVTKLTFLCHQRYDKISWGVCPFKYFSAEPDKTLICSSMADIGQGTLAEGKESVLLTSLYEQDQISSFSC